VFKLTHYAGRRFNYNIFWVLSLMERFDIGISLINSPFNFGFDLTCETAERTAFKTQTL
jgi:hypothetical protein